MPFKRHIMQDLLAWRQRSGRLPLLLRGARQVGKTEIIRQFGQHFESFVELNLEAQPELAGCFDSFDPFDVINNIAAMTGQEVIPGKTLLFIDEIQEVPRAIQALRYFKEKMPELDVVGAGSLLEFALNTVDFKMPVGRIEFLYLYPMSFYEYCHAANESLLLDAIKHATLQQPLSDMLHQKALKLYREYMTVGGMPAVVAAYLANRSLNEAQRLQLHLLVGYRGDFSKYAKQVTLPALQVVFDKLQQFLAQQIKYSKIDADFRSYHLKEAIQLLAQAGLVHRVYASAASSLPLNGALNYKKYKLLFLDGGLMCARSQLSAEVLMQADLTLATQGALTEQFVGQELLANAPSHIPMELYFWARDAKSSQAEVDYVIQHGTAIIPIEVKSGTTGRLKSLQQFMSEKDVPCGVRVSQLPMGFDEVRRIVSLPLYMMHRLDQVLSLCY